MKKITFPAWFNGPNGETQIFDCIGDVPKGWTSGAEKQTVNGAPTPTPAPTTSSEGGAPTPTPAPTTSSEGGAPVDADGFPKVHDL